jgi:hypothetical protein
VLAEPRHGPITAVRGRHCAMSPSRIRHTLPGEATWRFRSFVPESIGLNDGSATLRARA